MHYVVRRMGFRITRGWAALILVMGALVATAFWVGPLRTVPPELRLVLLSADGQFKDSLDLPLTLADTSRVTGSRLRLPLVLAAYNPGTRDATPRSVALSIPATLRLSNSEGGVYAQNTVPGNPLARYVFSTRVGKLEPGDVPKLLPELDTLWLEPNVPSYYCTAMADSIPEFTPAPEMNPDLLANVKIYYSVSTGRAQRQTGLLSVQLNPELMRRPPAPAPPVYPITLKEPELTRPETGPLKRIGSRTNACGDPGDPMEIRDVLWQNADGGRVFVLYFGGIARKFLYDLDRDSIIEYEMWDTDADGKFEAGRPARMPIPAILMPLRGIRVRKPVLAEAVAGDSTRADSNAATATPGAPAISRSPAIDTAALQRVFTRELFFNAEAGPTRFWRALQGDPPPVRRRADTGPRILGRPVPFPRPDTIRRDTLRGDTLRRDTIRGDPVVDPHVRN